MKNLTEWLKKKVAKWLDLPKKEDIQETQKELSRVRKEIEKLIDGSIVGCDLGYNDESEIIIVKYSRINNAFKVIASTKSRFATYQRFVQEMRRMCTMFNTQHVTIDAPTGIEVDLKARILPDKKLTDFYRRDSCT